MMAMVMATTSHTPSTISLIHPLCGKIINLPYFEGLLNKAKEIKPHPSIHPLIPRLQLAIGEDQFLLPIWFITKTASFYLHRPSLLFLFLLLSGPRSCRWVPFFDPHHSPAPPLCGGSWGSDPNAESIRC
ncbi:hypothetical protein SAY87_030042 [Trapa incisa]|uniref:Uncharacterized protein n=1 Tax=Trapa incisa TaxID=236973 RepID=A0AAN7KCU4_9MYRT|nr:hypothetical protein SAY87_030042 [Trapa incisa]